ncbi:hypothetical protein [Aestuariivirga sp.]|uniref:hypothetical protein n=1 Tax=Aestuariivirga sp. TaxID=2650926 RepID=UPI003593C184
MDGTPEQVAAPSIDDRIADYWREHGDVLTTPGHVDQPRLNDELTRPMHVLDDWQLERFCQARSVNGQPSKCSPGRDYETALAYALGVIGRSSGSKKAVLTERLQRFRPDVVERLAELGGPPDDLHKGI